MQWALLGQLGNGTGHGAVATPGCDNDWNTWWVGSRTQWNVTKDFYMGLDVIYSKLSVQRRQIPRLAPLSVGGATHVRRRTNGRSASACTATSIPDRVAGV